MQKLTFAAMVALCAVPASAAQIVQSTSNTAIPVEGRFSGFDQSLGTLTDVTLSIRARETRPGWIVGFVTEPGTLSWTIDGVSSFKLGPTSSAPLAEFAVPIFGEGTHDYTGNGGFTMRATGEATFQIDPLLIPTSNLRIWFTGPGFYDASDVTFVGGNAVQQLGQGGDLSWNNHLYTLTYTYTPFGAVPEPATWAMLLLGFGLVGAAMRRRGDYHVSAPHGPQG